MGIPGEAVASPKRQPQNNDNNKPIDNACASTSGGPGVPNDIAVLPKVENPAMFSVDQVQRLIELEMDRVLKRRLPSLGTEIRLRVDAAVSRAMNNDVPQMVGDILMRAADAYAEDQGTDTERRSIGHNRTIERSGRNLIVTLNDSIEAAAQITEVSVLGP